MVAEFLCKDGLPLVVGIEVHVEGVDRAGAVVVDHNAARLGAVRLAVRIGSHAFHPLGGVGHVVVGAQEDIFSAVRIQFVQIIQRQW
jgi:hypothetical protein